MFTRCPNCDTTFRVTPMQLKARAGTVRCGQCHFVFNALDTLADIPADFVGSDLATTDQEQTSLEPEDELLTDWGPLEGEEKSEPEEEPLESEHNASRELEQHETLSIADGDETLPEDEFGDDMRDAASPAEAEYEVPPASAPPASTTHDYLASPILHETESTTARWPWVFGSMLALVLLALQLTYYYRVELAALRPEWRPALLSFCSALNCDVPRPRHIDSISIESSDLRPDPQHAGHLALGATLRSKSPLAQEWPVLELTLTDVADRKLAVRHFGARDYLAKDGNRSALLAAGFPANAEIPVMLALDIGDLQAAGYRLYVFYP